MPTRATNVTLWSCLVQFRNKKWSVCQVWKSKQSGRDYFYFKCMQILYFELSITIPFNHPATHELQFLLLHMLCFFSVYIVIKLLLRLYAIDLLFPCMTLVKVMFQMLQDKESFKNIEYSNYSTTPYRWQRQTLFLRPETLHAYSDQLQL